MSENNNDGLVSSLTKRLEEEPARIAEAKKSGKKVLGYFCPYAPEEIIIAAGMIPVRLAFGGELEPKSSGEQFLKSHTCPYALSCLGYKAESKNFYYNAVDAICVAYTCDNMKRNQEYWERYFGKPVFTLGVPHTHDRFRSRPQAIKYFKNELELLRSKLGEFSGREIKNGDIRKAIVLCNSIREKLRKLFEYPLNGQSSVKWIDVLKISHAGFLMDRDDYLSELKNIEKDLSGKRPEATPDDKKIRLVICGSIIGIGDYNVLDIINQAGGNIIADNVCTGAMFYRKNATIFGIMGDPIDALAERYLYNVPCPCMMDLAKRLSRIIKVARDSKAQGVIYYNLKYCDPWRAEFGFIKENLRNELNIPTLLIETEYSPADVGTTRTKIEAFIEMITEGK